MSHFQIEAFKFLYIFSFSLGVWTSSNLIVKRRNDPYIRGALIVYILLLLGAPLNAYFNLIQSQPIDILAIVGQKLSWIYGPLLAIVVNRLLLKKVNIGYLPLHFLPFVFFSTSQFLRIFEVDFWLYVLLLYTQIICYLVYALSNTLTHRDQLNKLRKSYKASSYYWAMHLSMGLVVIMVLDLIIVTGLYFGLINSLAFTTILASAFSIYISGLALLFVYQPDFSAKNAEHSEPEEDESTEPESLSKITPALRNVELSPEAARELQAKLAQLVETHPPHQDADISLGKLAALLGITPHQLSELLNMHMGVSYYDFLNNLRHEESMKLLQDQRQAYSVTDIAYQSGYNNRNSFYKVFKDKTGMTPVQFKSGFLKSSDGS
jgi:AraC-like DNA-binding protein